MGAAMLRACLRHRRAEARPRRRREHAATRPTRTPPQARPPHWPESPAVTQPHPPLTDGDSFPASSAAAASVTEASVFAAPASVPQDATGRGVPLSALPATVTVAVT